LRLFSFGGYGFAPAALVLAVFGAYDSYTRQDEWKEWIEAKCNHLNLVGLYQQSQK